MQTLIDLLEFLRPYGSHSYFVMLGILVLCGFGLPMPEDVVLVSGGILASHGVTQFPSVVGVCLAGVLLGDGIVFTLGRTFGPAIKKWRIFQKIMPESRDQRVQHIIHKYGDKVIFMARFMPGLRTPIFLTCGTYHVKPWKFAAFDGFAALISVPLWIYVGFVFGENLEELERRIHQFQFGIYGVVAVALIALIFGGRLKKRVLRTTD
jgi:membrane protein DedA with SNARE-associated domain